MNLVLLLIFVIRVLTQEIELPTELNEVEFDNVTKDKLSFIEFYSPYCHHCKEFFPTWKKTYQQFKTENPEINVEMRQVNCVENGDLCNRENIDFYPNLQLYAPQFDIDGKKIGKAINVGSYPRNLDRTPENIIKYLKSSFAEFDKEGGGVMQSSSKLFTTNDIMSVIAGEMDIPHFITFFPATESQWNNEKARFPNADCVNAKQVWDRLSNKILSIIQTGHLMCRDHPEICEKLEVSGDSPKFIMFLPKSTGLIRMDYEDRVELERMKWWATKLFENTRFEVVSARGITEIMEYTKVLSHQPIAHFYPLKNKITVVFYYDVDAITKEDEDVLPYVVKMLQKSPFNIQLVKAKHLRIEENIGVMGNNLIDYINYDPDNKYEYDKALEVASKLTSKPTFIVFKDNSLIADVYQSYAPEDIRQPEKIEEFLERQFPLYNELTNDLVPLYFKDDRKVVVIFIDTKDMKKSDEELFKLSLSAHEYNYLQKKHNYEDILKLRQEKENQVENLKQKNADSTKITKASRKEVLHFWNDHEILFTFVDKSNPKIQKFNQNEYKVGDAIILNNKNIWSTNVNGQPLKNDPRELRDMFKGFLNNSDLKSHLLYTPYGGIFSFMDFIHQFGIIGYVISIVLIYIIISLLLKLRRKRRRRTDGIINLFVPKKD